jgi:hypothetical protein
MRCDLPVSDEPRWRCDICLGSWPNFWIMPSDWTGSSRLWHCHVDYAPGRTERLIQPYFNLYVPPPPSLLLQMLPISFFCSSSIAKRRFFTHGQKSGKKCTTKQNVRSQIILFHFSLELDESVQKMKYILLFASFLIPSQG